MSAARFALFDVGMGELLAILVVALLLFGGRLPEVARSLGRTVGDLKRSADKLSREFRHEMDDRTPPRPKPLVRPATSASDAPTAPPAERRAIARETPAAAKEADAKPGAGGDAGKDQASA